MHWKALLAIILILSIAGLLLFTDIGKNFVNSIRGNIAGFIRGNIAGFFSKIFEGQPGEPFTIFLTANRESFYGQSYSMSNSTLICSGAYNYIRIDGRPVAHKIDKTVDLKVLEFNGNFEVTSTGSIKISGSSSVIEISDWIISGKPMDVELEITPSNFLLLGVSQEKITLVGVTGEIRRIHEGKFDQVSLSSDDLEIKNFMGNLGLSETGMISLNGATTSVKGKKFSFG